MAVIFAILIGLGGAYGVRQILKEPEPEEKIAPRPPRPIAIPVAGYDLPAGRVVTLHDITFVKLTPDKLKKSKYANVPFINSTNMIIGRRLKVPVKMNEAFPTNVFYPDGMGPGIEELLKPGMVAKTLPIENADEMFSFISPGSLVDVFYRNSAPTPGVTVTLLERVEVLAVGKVVSPTNPVNAQDGQNSPGYRSSSKVGTVTVAVTPYQAKALTLVEGRGELRLALRNRNDFTSASVASSEGRLTLGQLMGLPIGIKARGMSVYQGGKRSTLIFDRKPVYDDRFKIKTPIPAEPPAIKKKAATGS